MLKDITSNNYSREVCDAVNTSSRVEDFLLQIYKPRWKCGRLVIIYGIDIALVVVLRWCQRKIS